MSETKKMGFTHDDKNNVTVDWWTPKWVFDLMGAKFALDPCSPKGGVPWIPAAKHYTMEDDGLAQPWNGMVWCNPPYGKYTGKWMQKMHIHANGVALVFARTDCQWFHNYVAKADALLFLKGRVQFVDATNATKGGGAGCGSLLAAWGNEAVDCLIHMKQKGHYTLKECGK